MAKWFYRKDGKEHGPVSEAALEALIRQNVLSAEDPICREGEMEWVLPRQIEGLERRNPGNTGNLHHFIELPKSELETAIEEPKAWVLLQRQEENNQTRFIQSGPFSTSELLQKIHGGEADFNDYVWQQGMPRWMRIGSMPEFDRRQVEENSLLDTMTETFPDLAAQSVRSETNESDRGLLKDVVVEPEGEKEEADFDRPPEAEGPDLTMVPPAPEFMPPSPPENLTATSGVRLQDDAEVIDLSEPKPERKKKKASRTKGVRPKRRQERLRAIRRTQITVVSAMLIAVGAFGWAVYRHMNRPAQPTMSTNIPVANKKEADPVKAPRRPERPGIKWVKNPSLILNPRNLSSSEPYLLIGTDAADGQMVRVTVKGEFGRFLGPVSFRKRLTLRKKNDEKLEVRFKHIGVPEGQMRVTVSSGGTRRELELFIGRKDARFTRQLSDQLKRYSQQYQKEKKQLYYLAEAQLLKLHQLLGELERNPSRSAWTRFFRNWSAQTLKATVKDLEDYAITDWNRYALASHWDELKTYRRRLFDLSRRDSPSQSQLRRLADQLRDFRGRVAELSLYQGF